MSGFEFKLEKVLDLRKEEEQLRAQRVASARREADAAREAMKNLETRRDGRTRLTTAHGGGRSVGQLQNLEWLLDRLEGEIEVAQEAVRAADAEAVARSGEHIEAVRDRQALDRLREKKLVGWKAGQAREEQKTLDEVAVTRHFRASQNASGGDGTS